ncbi:MAG: LPS-assembly protein LptD, partial [Planctomycetota bacterium]
MQKSFLIIFVLSTLIRPVQCCSGVQSATDSRGGQLLEKAVKPDDSSTGKKQRQKFSGSRNPVNFAPAGKVAPKIEKTKGPDGQDITTVIGRLYLWQRLGDGDRILELLADNAVIFSSASGQAAAAISRADIRAIYLGGDVVMTEGPRTIRADELYYDFEGRRALVLNAELRSFDLSRGIPIYVRAAKLRQLAQNKFAAENTTLTCSEFYKPQISMTATSMILTDTTTVEDQTTDSSYDAQMSDVKLKVDEMTVFSWPVIRSNMRRPDMPLESLHASYDNTWGPSLETRWYLSRLLGLAEPEGAKSTLGLDYLGKRGLGSSLDIDYSREDNFGTITGYLIDDHGEDKLGRLDSRRNLQPQQELRGRFRLQHRQFMPYNWQLTAETSYASDENFIESYYRGEFNADKKQETLLHMKRLEDNWAISVLAKARINDFADELEELPSIEFHLTGESFWDDMFTLYSDTRLSRMRQRIGDSHSTLISDEFFSFVSHRTEVDFPLRLGNLKAVPYAAGTFGYDDRSGFTKSIVDGSGSGRLNEDQVWLGEAGLRLSGQYWKVYPSVKSRLGDLEQLRHMIRPELTVVAYAESDPVVEQRDMLNLAISQRLQTRRRRLSPQGRPQYETVDWMRLDTDFTWVNNSSDSGPATARILWNRPMIPLSVMAAPEIFNGDFAGSLKKFELFGPS